MESDSPLYISIIMHTTPKGKLPPSTALMNLVTRLQVEDSNPHVVVCDRAYTQWNVIDESFITGKGSKLCGSFKCMNVGKTVLSVLTENLDEGHHRIFELTTPNGGKSLLCVKRKERSDTNDPKDTSPFYVVASTFYQPVDRP